MRVKALSVVSMSAPASLVTAMAAQAQLEGRIAGDRPSPGYKLIDAGPHPNRANAADGKRLHALAID